MFVLIPAYNPDEKLLDLLRELPSDVPVVIVNDGSTDEHDFIFEKAQSMGASILSHEQNRGKGAALRTGMAYIARQGEKEGVITADADGQHSCEDILKIAKILRDEPGTFVMGGRDFRQMPLRSFFGNACTMILYRMTTGIAITDTQTGLRGIPAQAFERVLSVEGDRYEYEMNVLLKLREWKLPYREVRITTIYHDNNKSSHFRPVFDGFRVFFRVLLYALSSLTCTLVDYAVFIILSGFNILPAICYALARILSAALNYQLNCRVVFGGKPSVRSAVEYAVLVLFIMALGSGFITYLTMHRINSIIAKVIVDCVNFVINYFVQKKVIFRQKKQ